MIFFCVNLSFNFDKFFHVKLTQFFLVSRLNSPIIRQIQVVLEIHHKFREKEFVYTPMILKIWKQRRTRNLMLSPM